MLRSASLPQSANDANWQCPPPLALVSPSTSNGSEAVNSLAAFVIVLVSWVYGQVDRTTDACAARVLHADFSLEEDLPEVLATIDWLVLDPSGLQSPIGEDAGSIFWFTCEVLPWLVDHLEEEQARYAGLEEESTGRSHVSDAGKKGAWSAATYLAYVLTWHGLEVSDWVMRMFALLALAEGERAQALGCDPCPAHHGRFLCNASAGQ